MTGNLCVCGHAWAEHDWDGYHCHVMGCGCQWFTSLGSETASLIPMIVSVGTSEDELDEFTVQLLHEELITSLYHHPILVMAERAWICGQDWFALKKRTRWIDESFSAPSVSR